MSETDNARKEEMVGAERPTEYYVVWEEEQDAGSLSWATRLARQKSREGKGAVQLRRRVNLYQTENADGSTRWTWDDDECIADAF